MKVTDLIPTVYQIDMSANSPQFCLTGPSKFAIRSAGRSCLNKLGEWEYEPFPSNRTDDFLERCRYDSLEEAVETYNKFVEKSCN